MTVIPRTNSTFVGNDSILYDVDLENHVSLRTAIRPIAQSTAPLKLRHYGAIQMYYYYFF